MIEKQLAALRLADALAHGRYLTTDAGDPIAEAAAELRILHAENDSLRSSFDRLKYAHDVLRERIEALRTGYDAARLEIESLKARVQEPLTDTDDFALRGVLAASLDCWHRMHGSEADELVAFVDRLQQSAAGDALDTGRLDFLIAERAYVVSDPDVCEGFWLHWTRNGETWVQVSEHATPRAAIDAARAAQGGTHGQPT